MSDTKLTPNEIIAMELTLNYNDRESQQGDNYSVAGVKEIRAELGWSGKQVGGLISSLEQKGMAVMDDEGYDLLWLTDEGVNAIFDIIEGR